MASDLQAKSGGEPYQDGDAASARLGSDSR
jgi:hypothetical protein